MSFWAFEAEFVFSIITEVFSGGNIHSQTKF